MILNFYCGRAPGMEKGFQKNVSISDGSATMGFN